MCCQIHPNSHPIQYLIPIFGWVRCLPVVTYIAHVPSYPQNTTLGWLEIYASKRIIHLFRCWIHRFVSFEVWYFTASIPHNCLVRSKIYIYIYIITYYYIWSYHDISWQSPCFVVFLGWIPTISQQWSRHHRPFDTFRNIDTTRAERSAWGDSEDERREPKSYTKK